MDKISVGHGLPENIVDLDEDVKNNIKNLYLAGIPINKLMKKYKLTAGDLKPYLPMDKSEISQNKIHCISF